MNIYKTILHTIIRPVIEFDEAAMQRAVTRLRQVDGEMWAVGEMLARALEYARLTVALVEKPSPDRPLVQGGTDAYKDLRNATPEQLLEAVIWSLRQSATASFEPEEAIGFLCTGFALAQPGGWEHVAPWWLRESRKIAALDMKGER